MFIEDIRNDFYNVLLGNRVLLLVHYDVDAICACKILQDLFKCDNILYTLVPVGGISELKTAYDENNEEIKYVVLINCGGTIDLVDILQPEEDVIFFVLDSHKPTDICNVYSDGQVRLIYKDEEENIPNFDDIFRDDEEEEEETEGREDIETIVEKRRERKAWEEKRHTLMFNYTQFSYYGKPSACTALELAVRCSRCTTRALWAAAAAGAAHAALQLRSPARALLDAEPLHRYVAAQLHGDDVYTGARVVVEKDAWLPLYRWWSLEAALAHSALAPALRLHARSGAARLRQLLADMGFPLQQARQAYRSMDVDLRRSLLTALETAAAKHKLPTPTRATFLLQRPHAPVVAALDVVYAIMALIEHETIPRAEGFQLALACLDVSGENDALKQGIAAAKQTLEAVARLVHNILSSRGLMLAGPFNYFIVQDGVPEAAAVAGPLWLGAAARWVARAAPARPLLCAAHALLLGLPPHHHQDPRNLFGAAFEQAATKSGISVSLDYVDSSIITVPISQRAQFLDALTALLA